jgi:hypothetical protein
MTPITGYTVSELIEKSGKSRSAIESYISRHKIEPLSYEARYPVEVLDALLKVKMGRPAKKPNDPSPEPSTKSPKQS